MLEIGAGAGALTRELAKEAKRVISFEIDRSLQPILDEILSDKKNVSLYFEDILKRKTEAIESLIGEDYLVVANLPYYITTPLIMRFVEESTRCKRLVVMVQEEVADRLVAREGTPAYGAVTVAVNVAGRAEKLRARPAGTVYAASQCGFRRGSHRDRPRAVPDIRPGAPAGGGPRGVQ